MTVENDAVTTVYEPPHRAGMKGTSRNAPFEVLLTFDSVEGGTRVEAQIDFLMTGVARLFEGIFIRSYVKSWNQGMVNLKRMMEAGEL